MKCDPNLENNLTKISDYGVSLCGGGNDDRCQQTYNIHCNAVAMLLSFGNDQFQMVQSSYPYIPDYLIKRYAGLLLGLINRLNIHICL